LRQKTVLTKRTTRQSGNNIRSANNELQQYAVDNDTDI